MAAALSSLLDLKAVEVTSFLQPSPSLAQLTREAASKLAGEAVADAEIHVAGMDAEQVWLQLEEKLWRPAMARISRQVKKVVRLCEEEGRGEGELLMLPQDEGWTLEERKLQEDFEIEEEGGGLGNDIEEGKKRTRAKKGGEMEGTRKKARGKEPPELTAESLEKYLDEAEAMEGREDEGVIPELYEAGDVLSDDADEEEEGEGEDGEGEEGGDRQKGIDIWKRRKQKLPAMTDEDGSEKDKEEAGGSSKTMDPADIRYEDFFEQADFGNEGGATLDLPEDDFGEEGASEAEDEEDADLDMADGEDEAPDVADLSSHERRTARIKQKIEELEAANLGPKDWTMAGEVVAGKRPRDSALEVELDFEHASRPPPVITEEVTASLEDLIRQRVLEGRFDDVERRATAVTSVSKELPELDDSKSQRGLAEIYEAEYAEAAGQAPAATSSTDAIKQEAAKLFRQLCARLDALSHFHFAPKPVIEDIGVRADVPALAMEEVAPMAVSDASLLAPEEVFQGKRESAPGDPELDELSRTARRRKQKRPGRPAQASSEKKKVEKALRGAAPDATLDKSRSTGFTNSRQVFANLEEGRNSQIGHKKASDVSSKRPEPSALKL